MKAQLGVKAKDPEFVIVAVGNQFPWFRCVLVSIDTVWPSILPFFCLVIVYFFG